MKSENLKSVENERQFAENLSHELLTPLSIIWNEAELLLQSEHLSKDDIEHVDKILETVNRLSRINKGLILLSKINQGIYVDREDILVSEMIADLLKDFEGQLKVRNIEVEYDSHTNLVLHSNPTLVEILLTNAIKNATVHNISGGHIKIRLTSDSIEIENTGQPIEGDIEEYFKRFVSGSKSSYSIGLGLSIMNQICEELKFSLSYENRENLHLVTIGF